jgi:Mg-chelatase subunit ChlD
VSSKIGAGSQRSPTLRIAQDGHPVKVQSIERWEVRGGLKLTNFAHRFGLVIFTATMFATLSLQSQTSSQCAESKLLVNALNRDNRRIAGLKAADFAVTLGKKQASITKVEMHPLAPRVIILLDVSGSMGEHQLPKAERFVMQTLLQEFPADIPLAVMTFSDGPQLIADFSLNRESLRSSVFSVLNRRETWKGRTQLASAIEKAIDAFGAPVIGDSILLVSDGGANWNEHNGFGAARLLNSSGVRLFAHLWNEDGLRGTMEELTGQSVTSQVVEKSGGGLFWSVPNDLGFQPAKIVELDREIVGQIAFPYLMNLQLEFSGKWTPVRLKIDKNKVSDRQKIRLQYPQELPPCTTSDPS